MTVVRRAGPDDVDAAQEVWRADLAAAGSRPSTVRRAEVREQLAAPDGVLVVAEADHSGAAEPAVVGFALGRWERDRTGQLLPGAMRLAMLVVHPGRRRQGIGTALAEGLADAGWPRGARQLLARPADATARSFLLACGLEPADRGDGPRPVSLSPKGTAAAAGSAGGPVGEPSEDLVAEQGDLVGQLEAPVREVLVRGAGLRLGQLLKLAGLVDTGAEAKALLSEGAVEVNGELELRRGRQLVDGDLVLAHSEAVRVVLAPA